MKKVVINNCFGGFGLSGLAMTMYQVLKNEQEVFFYDPVPGTTMREYVRTTAEEAGMSTTVLTHDHGEFIKNMRAIPDEERVSEYGIERDDPQLVEVVEKLGSEKSSGCCAELNVVEIPDDVEWHIEEYDGLEHIAETHRTWS